MRNYHNDIFTIQAIIQRVSPIGAFLPPEMEDLCNIHKYKPEVYGDQMGQNDNFDI